MLEDFFDELLILDKCKNQAENPAYLTINEPQGRLVLAGDYFSFLSGWMEGAVRSAELAVKRIARMTDV